MIFPAIISASRSTDIPAFYSKWFINRLKKGFVKWFNPFNGKPQIVSFEKARAIVFWSKNPKPLFQYLDWFDAYFPNYYFQFTLNNYQKNLEKNIPCFEKRIETFIKLSEKIGKKRIIWRFDPLILTDKINIDKLLQKIEYTGNLIYKYTEKLVISFLETSYRKVRTNLKKNNINFINFDDNLKIEVAKGIFDLNKKWNLKTDACAEKMDLTKYNILKNKCIDDDLLAELFPDDNELMHFLKRDESLIFDDYKKIYKKIKDKGQRKYCGCIKSKDIGQYNTCPHLCTYCYANSSEKIVKRNFENFKNKPFKDSIF